MAQTVLQQFAKYLTDRCRQSQRSRGLKVSKGGCHDFAAYKEECGRNKGLDEAIGLINEAVTAAELQEDDGKLPDMNLGNDGKPLQ